MPIRRFHSIEEMKQRTSREPGDPSLYRSIKFVLDVGRRTRPRRFPSGVHKHRSIEALNAQTECWRATPSVADVGDAPRHSGGQCGGKQNV